MTKKFILFSIMLLAIDQLLKVYYVDHLLYRGNEYFYFESVYANYVSFVLWCIFLIYLLKNFREFGDLVKYFHIMVAVGGFSNIVDLLLRKEIVDYINLSGNYYFNFADLYITCGIIAIIIFSLDPFGLGRGKSS